MVGGLKIKSQYPEQTLSIFIQVSSFKVLEQRLRTRGTESENLLNERIAKAKVEVESAPEFDLVIVNKDLEEAKKQMLQRVKAFVNT